LAAPILPSFCMIQRDRPRLKRYRAMKLKPVMIVASLLAAAPALGATPDAESFCYAEAVRANLIGRGQGEAFIANCLADQASAPPAKRDRHKKPR